MFPGNQSASIWRHLLSFSSQKYLQELNFRKFLPSRRRFFFVSFGWWNTFMKAVCHRIKVHLDWLAKCCLKLIFSKLSKKWNDDEFVIFSFIKSVDRYLDACNKRSQKQGCVNCFSQLLNTYKLMLNLALL